MFCLILFKWQNLLSVRKAVLQNTFTEHLIDQLKAKVVFTARLTVSKWIARNLHTRMHWHASLSTDLLAMRGVLSMLWRGISSHRTLSVPCRPSGTRGRGGNLTCSMSLSVYSFPVRHLRIVLSSALRSRPWDNSGSRNALVAILKYDN